MLKKREWKRLDSELGSRNVHQETQLRTKGWHCATGVGISFDFLSKKCAKVRFSRTSASQVPHLPSEARRLGNLPLTLKEIFYQLTWEMVRPLQSVNRKVEDIAPDFEKSGRECQSKLSEKIISWSGGVATTLFSIHIVTEYCYYCPMFETRHYFLQRQRDNFHE